MTTLYDSPTEKSYHNHKISNAMLFPTPCCFQHHVVSNAMLFPTPLTCSGGFPRVPKSSQEFPTKSSQEFPRVPKRGCWRGNFPLVLEGEFPPRGKVPLGERFPLSLACSTHRTKNASIFRIKPYFKAIIMKIMITYGFFYIISKSISI
jgi:hypothetical protein